MISPVRQQQHRAEEVQPATLQVLMDVYSKLGACEGFLKDAASEVYCTTIRGRWCFLPGIMWLTLGRWRLPKDVRSLTH